MTKSGYSRQHTSDRNGGPENTRSRCLTRRNPFGLLSLCHQVIDASKRNTIENCCYVAATVGSMHQGMKQIALLMVTRVVVIIHAMRSAVSHFTVAYFMEIANSRQYRSGQHCEHQQ
jgi:hypothetical protein